jgi:hypothetical protein
LGIVEISRNHEPCVPKEKKEKKGKKEKKRKEKGSSQCPCRAKIAVQIAACSHSPFDFI